MKKILLLSLLLLPTFAFAASQPPQKINVQAVLVDEGGNVLSDLQEASIIFSIIDGAGATLYQERQEVILVHGAISVLVGDGTDVNTGAATGGIPSSALSPDGGSRLLRIQIEGQSIPQEDMELTSVPYSYFADVASSLSSKITTDDIEDGTVAAVDLSTELMDLINNAVSGVSEEDLQNHINSSSAHTAANITVSNTFVNLSGNNVQDVFESIDASLNGGTTAVSDEEAARTSADATLQANIDAEAAARAAADASEAATRASADADLQAQIDTEESARIAGDNALTAAVAQEILDRQAGDADLQSQIDAEEAARIAADELINDALDQILALLPVIPDGGTLDDIYVNTTGDTMTGQLTVNGANVVINSMLDSASNDVGGGLVVGKENFDTTVIDGLSGDIEVNDDVYVHGDLTALGNITVGGTVDGEDVSDLGTRVDQLEDGTTNDPRYVNVTGDTMTGALDMSSQNISNVGALTVTSVVASTISGNGAAITNINGSNIAYGTVDEAYIDSDIARDSEITSALASYVAKAGDTMTGNLSMGGNNITSVGDISATSATIGTLTATTVNATTLSGNGSAITALNGSNISSGTVDEAYIDSDIARDSEVNSLVTSIAGSVITSGTVNEAYIDSTIARDSEVTAAIAALADTYVNTTGDTMTGDLAVLANVGIGTSAPGDDLHVYGHSMTVEDPDSSDDAAYILQVNNIRQWAESGSASDHPYGHAYWIYDFVAGAVRLLIDDSGNVGVGTEDPQANLHVYDSGNSGVRINGGTQGYLQLGTTNGYALLSDGTTFNINRDAPLGSGAGTVFSLDASGNMDIPGDAGSNTATIAHDLTMTAGDINMAAGATVDGVDVSALNTTVNNFIRSAPTNDQGAFAYGTLGSYVRDSGVPDYYNIENTYNISSADIPQYHSYARVYFTSDPTNTNYVVTLSPNSSGIDYYVCNKQTDYFDICPISGGYTDENIDFVVFWNN